MDKTETYIKQCEKAGEIQHCVKSEFIGNPEYVFVRVGKGIQAYPYIMIWLPRQDQLQAMLRDKGYMLPESLPWIAKFAVDEGANKYKSMERLWLAFVMKSLHSKEWSGSEWVASC